SSPCSAGRCVSCPGPRSGQCSCTGSRLAGLLVRFVIPAELGTTAHPRAGGDRQRPRLQVTVQDASLQQLDLGGRFDVAFELAGDDDGVGAYSAGDARAGFDGEIALNVDVAFEISGDPDVSGAFDLAFDGESRCDHGLLGVC